MNFKKVLILLFAFLASCGVWAANGWTIQASTNGNVTTFTISRTNTAAAETVRYRLVNLSAYAGQHYRVTAVNGNPVAEAQQAAALSGTFTFAAGENTSRTIVVRETTSDGSAYWFQSTGTERSYKLELTDNDGFFLTSETRTMSTGSGTQLSTAYLNTGIVGMTYFDYGGNGSLLAGNMAPGSGSPSIRYLDVAHSASAGTWIKVTDGGYSQRVNTISTDGLYNNGNITRNFLNSLGTKMYATVYFTQKEENDGYQYIQIYTNAYDGNDPNGGVNDPVNSLYKACFILSYAPSGSVETTPHTQFFPHRWDYADRNAQYNGNHWNWQEFDYDNAHLYAQKFKSATPSYRAENSGSLVLSTTVNSLNVRFDAAGSGDDDWYFKDLKVRLALVDAIAPTVLARSVAPGRHSKGNTLYLSLAFSEPVTITGSTRKLATSWGDLSYQSGSGTNVLTFSGTIQSSATGSLSVTGLTGTIADLAGNSLNGNAVNADGLCSLDASTVYTISYDLDGGSASNPTSYTWETATFTLNNPTRLGYWFDGWTGSNGDTPQTSVTINTHDHINKSYTAHWTDAWGIEGGADGSSEHPYTITSTQGLDLLAQYVNSGHDCSDLYFQLDNDIDYSPTTDWNDANSEENNYTAIGYYASENDQSVFRGTFDGRNHTVSGIRIYKSGSDIRIDEYQGLFGFVFNGAIRNVNLANARITAYGSTGGIVGYSNSCTIEDCTVGADVCIHAVRNTAYEHGGIVGNNWDGYVRRCISRATLTVESGKTPIYYGGIFGYTDRGDITDCLAIGVTIPDLDAHGAIGGCKEGATVARNYYLSCTVAGQENATDVGLGTYSHATSDVVGIHALYAVTLPEHASLVRTASDTLPGTNNRTYTTGADIDNLPYAYATATLRLSYDAASIPSGYALASLSVKETASGNAVDVTDNGDYTYDFTMPAAAVTVTANVVQIISYIDADGTEQNCIYYTVIESSNDDQTLGSSSNSQPAWYVVLPGTVTVTGKLWFDDPDVRLILCDGATLTVTRSGDVLKSAHGSLTLYGQARQSGTLNATATSNSGQAIISTNGDINNITINGGIVNATANGTAIEANVGNITINRGFVTVNSDEWYGIYASRSSNVGGDITINGGTVSTIGSQNGIYASRNITINGGIVSATCSSFGINGSTITLGCPTVADRITASSYRGTVIIADGQTLTDGTATYSGTLNIDQKAALAGKTLYKALFDVSYLDENGDPQTTPAGVFVTPFHGNDATLGNSDHTSWYLVSGTTTPDAVVGDVSLAGDVNIILEDGCSFNDRGSYSSVDLNGHALTLYAQSTGSSMGKFKTANCTYLVGSGSIFSIRGGRDTLRYESSDVLFDDISGAINITGGRVFFSSGIGYNSGYVFKSAGGVVTLGYVALSDTIKFLRGRTDYAMDVRIREGQSLHSDCDVFTGNLTHLQPGDAQNYWYTDVYALSGGCRLAPYTAPFMRVEKDQWAAVAFPVMNDPGRYSIDNGYIYGLDNDAYYDIFQYRESAAEWYSVLDNSYELKCGVGYIFRRAKSVILGLQMDRVAPTGDYDFNAKFLYGSALSNNCSNSDLRGFHLIGNPYQHAIYKGVAFDAEATKNFLPGYYSLNGDGSWQVHPDSDPIAPMQAVLVRLVPESEGRLLFHDTDDAPSSGSKGLKFTVKGNDHEDVAYAILNEERGMMNEDHSSLIIHHSSLFKVGHLNAEAPSLSIDGYAIATLGDSCKAFPLTLQAQPGSYTISMGLIGDMGNVGYCHLIDKVAGRDIDLLQTPNYTFTQSRNQAFTDRFLVKLSPKLNTEHLTLNTPFAYQQGNEIIVTGEGTLEAYDVMGRKLFTREANSSLIIHHSSFPGTGVYILRLGGQSQKIVIK